MPFAVLLQTHDRPTAEALRRAFEAVDVLVGLDAAAVARERSGIVAWNLRHEDAARLTRALGREEIAAQSVDQATLVKLPSHRALKQADCRDDGLVAFDALNRPSRFTWSQVMVLAIGSVPIRDLRRGPKQMIGTVDSTAPVSYTPIKYMVEERLVAELILDAEPYRYRIRAREFRYNYLGQRLQRGYAANFAELVNDLVRYATQAELNLGALAVREQQGATVEYASLHAFEEELVWLLWQASRKLDP